MEWKRVITPPAPMRFVSIVVQFVNSVEASIRWLIPSGERDSKSDPVLFRESEILKATPSFVLPSFS